MRYHKIRKMDISNGPGVRVSIFMQGCTFNCKNCFNPETHDFNGGELMDMNELINDAISNPIINGITFSGGDPLEQAESFSYMAKEFKRKGLNIWCYTGYTFEQILEKMKKDKDLKELISNVDVLVDGKFEMNNKNKSLKFRGSSNQRIIDVKQSLEIGTCIVLI